MNPYDPLDPNEQSQVRYLSRQEARKGAFKFAEKMEQGRIDVAEADAKHYLSLMDEDE